MQRYTDSRLDKDDDCVDVGVIVDIEMEGRESRGNNGAICFIKHKLDSDPEDHRLAIHTKCCTLLYLTLHCRQYLNIFPAASSCEFPVVSLGDNLRDSSGHGRWARIE